MTDISGSNTVSDDSTKHYTPKHGDIMADGWIIPADGTPPFRISGDDND